MDKTEKDKLLELIYRLRFELNELHKEVGRRACYCSPLMLERNIKCVACMTQAILDADPNYAD